MKTEAELKKLWDLVLIEYTKNRYISDEEVYELSSIFNRRLLQFFHVDLKQMEFDL